MTEKMLRIAMDTYGDTVFRLALCRLQNTADAEDVYQDVFLKLFQQERLNDSDSEHIKAWLIRSTLNRCTDVMRFRFRNSVVSLNALGEIAAVAEESTAELWAAVSRLPAKFRVVVHLHYAEGYSTAEIADILQIPAVTVRTRLRRARLKLKDVLGGNEDE